LPKCTPMKMVFGWRATRPFERLVERLPGRPGQAGDRPRRGTTTPGAPAARPSARSWGRVAARRPWGRRCGWRRACELARLGEERVEGRVVHGEAGACHRRRVAEAEALGDLEAHGAELLGLGELGGEHLAVVAAAAHGAHEGPRWRRRRCARPSDARPRAVSRACCAAGPGNMPERLTTPSMPSGSMSADGALDGERAECACAVSMRGSGGLARTARAPRHERRHCQRQQRRGRASHSDANARATRR
jgi:hypothetical protein